MRMTAIASSRKIWPDEELAALPKDGHKYELLDGDLIMSPVHENHSMVCMLIGSALLNYVKLHALGNVYDSSLVVVSRRICCSVRTFLS